MAHNKLFSDDTYIFVAGTKVVNAALKTLDNGGTAAALAAEWRAGVMEALGTMYSKYKFGWAKPSIHAAFQEAAKHRLLLSKEQRAQLDKWTTTLQARRTATRANTLGAASGAALRRPGGFVHPLHNRRVT